MMVIYTCASPGGFQFWGRILPCWDTYGSKSGYDLGRPWFFQGFDQIEFYQVEQAEYDSLLAQFKASQLEVTVQETMFDVEEYKAFLESINPEVEQFKQRQQKGAEREKENEDDLYRQWLMTKASDGSEPAGNDGSIGSLANGEQRRCVQRL